MSFRLHDVDPIGLAMDWLETCKRKQLAALSGTFEFKRENGRTYIRCRLPAGV